MPRYTDSAIIEAAKNADSITEVVRRLGIIRWSAGTHGNIKHRMMRLGIDVNSMARKGRAWAKGKTFSAKRRSPQSILLLRNSGKRQSAKYLRRSLLTWGRSYVCVICGNTGVWKSKPLILEIDHKNGNRLDDRFENLRFLCPNCHSQN